MSMWSPRRLVALVGPGVFLITLVVVAAARGGTGWRGLVMRTRSVSAEGGSSSRVSLSVPGVVQQGAQRVGARASVVIHAPTGRVLAAQDAFTDYPIASLTKLMSVMVALDAGVDLDADVALLPQEYTVGGNLRVAPLRETVTNRDLVYAVITGSANNAALALARSTGMSREDFVTEMNRKAVSLGLEHIQFADPTGLSPSNVGSAYDVARLAAVALTEYPLIRDAASRGAVTIVTRNTGREHVVKNPNALFQDHAGVFSSSKTGYIHEALYCLMLAQDTPDGLVIAVTLGHPAERGIEQETLALMLEAQGRVAGVSATRDGAGE